MSGASARLQERNSAPFTMTVGESMDDVLDAESQWPGDTESDSNDEDAAGQKRKVGFKSLSVDAGYLKNLKREAKKQRRAQRNQDAQDLDAIMETTAQEEGRLNIRTIEDLTKASGGEGGLLKTGDRFLCREEVMVRIAEDSELQQRLHSTHSSKTGGAQEGQKKSRGQYQSRVVVSVCADDEDCEYITRAAFAQDDQGGGEKDHEEPWEIMEYRPHTCARTHVAAAVTKAGKGKRAGGKKDEKKKKKKGAAQEGRGAPGRVRRTAYTADMLARAVTPAVISTARYSKAQVKEVAGTLQLHVRMQVSRMQAVRARDRCIEMWHGSASSGASRVPAIAHALVQKGYWVRMHIASEKQMVEMTVRGLHAQHEAIQRGLRKSDRVEFDLRTVHMEVKQFFAQTTAQGKQYFAGVSFCNPAARDVIGKKQVHLVSFTDSCHGHSPALGHITSTNVLDAGRHVVPAMTSIFSFNESKASQLLHYAALVDCHSDVDAPVQEGQPVASVMNNAEHHAIMDGGKGGIQAADTIMPEATLFLCSRHMQANVADHAGGAKAVALYYRGLKCTTMPQLQKLVDDEFTDKMREYLKRQKGKAKNMHVFPAEVEVRGNTTGNVVEGTHAADASARKLAMDRSMEEYATLHGTRYYVNRTAAHSCQHKAPPKVQEKMRDLIERAAALKGEVTMQDPANPARGARVPTLKNTFVTSDISGDRRQTDVQCTCGSPSTNGFPCIHNVKHAQLIGMDPYDLLHYKDTTAAWREQYDANFVFPTLSSEDIQDDKINTDYVYPPIPPPKVGRPKKAVRMKGSKEKARQRKYSLPICGACGNAGHIASNKECPSRKQGASGGVKRKR